MLAGSIPDFWLGLILIFVFFSLTGILPGPIGQLDPIVSTPPRITGAIALDALLGGPWAVDSCNAAYPDAEELLPGRQVACFRAREMNALNGGAAAEGPSA